MGTYMSTRRETDPDMVGLRVLHLSQFKCQTERHSIYHGDTTKIATMGQHAPPRPDRPEPLTTRRHGSTERQHRVVFENSPNTATKKTCQSWFLDGCLADIEAHITPVGQDKMHKNDDQRFATVCSVLHDSR